jgi:hypothetical protein
MARPKVSKTQGILAALVLGGSIAALAVPESLSAAVLDTIASGLLAGILAAWVATLAALTWGFWRAYR